MSTQGDSPFDPYHKWLGIPPAEQPPHHYRLLGLALLENDPEVIAAAADRQMAHVKSFAAGRYAAHSQQLLNELSKARVRLLNPARKQEYDTLLRQKIEAQRAKAQAAAPKPASPAAAPPRPAAAAPPAPVVPAPSAPAAPSELPAIKPAVRRRRRKSSGNQMWVNLLWLTLGIGMLMGLVWLAGQLAN